jgi:hypothetical protein
MAPIERDLSRLFFSVLTVLTYPDCDASASASLDQLKKMAAAAPAAADSSIGQARKKKRKEGGQEKNEKRTVAKYTCLLHPGRQMKLTC